MCFGQVMVARSLPPESATVVINFDGNPQWKYRIFVLIGQLPRRHVPLGKCPPVYACHSTLHPLVLEGQMSREEERLSGGQFAHRMERDRSSCASLQVQTALLINSIV